MTTIPHDAKVALHYNQLHSGSINQPYLDDKRDKQLGIILTNLPRRSTRKTLTDIGSGVGLWSALLSPYFGQIVSIEPNDNMREKQKELFHRLHIENVDIYPDSMPDCIDNINGEAVLLSDCIGYTSDWLQVYDKVLADPHLQWIAISGGPDDDKLGDEATMNAMHGPINNRRPINPGDEWRMRDIAEEQGWATKMFDILKDELADEGRPVDRWLLILER
jgi:SAM-dependent methyltransferase